MPAAADDPIVLAPAKQSSPMVGLVECSSLVTPFEVPQAGRITFSLAWPAVIRRTDQVPTVTVEVVTPPES